MNNVASVLRPSHPHWGDLLLSLAQLDQIERQEHQHAWSCSKVEAVSLVVMPPVPGASSALTVELA
jgi:hypothetical protein